MNGDVWKGLAPQQQEAVRSAVFDTFVRGHPVAEADADAIDEMAHQKHGTQLLVPRRDPDRFLNDLGHDPPRNESRRIVLQESYDSQREYAA